MQDNSTGPSSSQAEVIFKVLNLLHPKGAVVELRILNTTKGTISGYFDDFRALCKLAHQESGKVPAVYITLNPARKDLLARACNRIKTYVKTTTSDADIIKRCWFGIDIDCIRPTDISSTDKEHKLALSKTFEIKAFLRSLGWPAPILGDSGNGGHLLFQIDLPNNNEASNLLRRCLEALDFLFSDERVSIDRAVYNASRIWKLYGTMACKGDNTPERPHRFARLLEVPSEMVIVSQELLQNLAAMLPETPKHESKNGGSYKSIEIENWITAHGLTVRRTKSWQGGTVYELAECPFNPEHNHGEASIIQFSNGALVFKCFHNSCQGNDWHALREKLEPGWRERKSSNGFDKDPVENGDIIEALREIAKLEFASEQEMWLKKLSERSGITLGALREDLKRLEEKDKSKSESQTHSKPEPKLVDLLAESKPSLHPAMDLIDGKLCLGTSSGVNSMLIHERQLLNISEISKQYELTGLPNPLRFSVNGIKTYHNGAEIRGPDLYKWIFEFLSKYIVFRAKWQVVVTVVWVIGTYLHRCFDLYPYLWIQSPTKRCGKTLFLEILAEMCFNSKGVETAPTEAVLFREPALTAGTLCWDEAEGLTDATKKGERNSILNVSFRKGGKVSRCEGDSHEVKDYEVYRPIALAGISSLPDTAADRSLKIELIRKRKDEKVERMKLRRLRPEFQSLRDALHIFALERAPKIIEAYEDFTDDLIPVADDRLRDIFEVLFSLALGLFCYDTEGLPPILASLKEAANALSGVRSAAEGDISFIQAIQILKLELDRAQGENLILKSEEAVRLFQSGGIEWVLEPKHARGILRKLGFSSASHRVKDEFVRGYEITLDKIEDLFQRYGSNTAEEE